MTTAHRDGRHEPVGQPPPVMVEADRDRPGTPATFSAAWRQHQREKQASRDADALALASGKKSREQLRDENTKVRIARVDWARVRAPRRA